MKWIGILLGGTALILYGNSQADALNQRVRLLSLIQQLLFYAGQELELRKISTKQLLTSLSRDKRFSQLTFLKKVSEEFTGLSSPETLWKDALSKQKNLKMVPEGQAILEEFGEILGESDWKSQAFDAAEMGNRLNALLSEAREKARREGRLRRSLSVLGSLLFAILVL